MNETELKDYEKYKWEYNGVVGYVNPHLCKRLKISDNTLEKIKGCQAFREMLSQISVTTSEGILEEFHDNEFELQRLWGFSENKDYHRFWDLSGCSCPVIDNEDAYPIGPYWYSGDCKLHKYFSKQGEQ